MEGLRLGVLEDRVQGSGSWGSCFASLGSEGRVRVQVLGFRQDESINAHEMCA